MTTELNDDVLLTCNETELLAIAHRQGLGHLKRGLSKDLLIKFVRGEEDPFADHMANTRHTRKLLEALIQKHFETVRSQLPGCDGKCTTWPCSEGRHALCFAPNRDAVLLK